MAVPYTNIFATTIKHYVRQLADNVTTHIPIIKAMKDKNNIKVQGGTSIQFPMEYGDNTSVMSYEGYTTLNITDDEIITAGEVRWGRYNVAIQYSDDDEAFNSGDAKIVDFIEARIKNAERSLIKRLGKDIILDGSGNAGKDMYGLAYYLSKDPTAAGTVAGVDQLANAWWRNKVVDNATYGAWGSATNKNGRQAVEDLFTQLVRNEEFPDMAFMSRTNYRNLKKEFELSEIYQPVVTDGTKKKEYGSRGFSFDGVDMLFDDNFSAANANADLLYALNSNYMKLYIHSKKNFQYIPMIRPINQASFVGHIRVYLNLVCTNRFLQGVVKTIS